MRVFRGIDSIERPFTRSVAGIGIFDGVHIGHKEIIWRVVRKARRLGCRAVIVTFDPHPAKTLGRASSPPRLLTLEHRLRLIGKLGVDAIVVVKFNRRFARIAPRGFVEEILVKRLGLKEIVVSKDFRFGRNRRGDIGLLESLGGALGFGVRAVRPVRRGGKAVSSSLIRRLILKGDLGRASALLGRPVSILGRVVHGSKRGRILGFPTANIDPHHEAIPPSGVYAVRVRLNGKRRGGVLNIGLRPTFGAANEPTIEVHVFDFNRRIYGRTIEVEFVKKLRNELRFADRHSLIRQIAKDEIRAKRALALSSLAAF